MGFLADPPLVFDNWPVALLRLVVAFVVGAVLGFERERRERPAGLRTHVLVSVTACLSVVGCYALSGDPTNPARVAQGVLTGIGFLGAGTIIRHGNVVRGLTTAASIWAAAALGLVVGSGLYLAAIAAALLVVVALTLLRRLEALVHQETGPVHVRARLRPGEIFPLGLAQTLAENGVEVVAMDLVPGERPQVRLSLEVTGHLSEQAVVALVRSCPALEEARLEVK